MNTIKKEQLFEEFRAAINRLGIENDSDIPDFILAGFAVDAVVAASSMVRQRDRWFCFTPWKPEQQQQQQEKSV